MKNTKLSRLLESLKGRELASLRKFLDSPYFTESKQPLELFDLLVKGNLIRHEAEKKEAFKQLYPGQPYQASKINGRYHRLYQMVERFLSQQEFQQNKELQVNARKQVLRKSRRYKEFRKVSLKYIDALPADSQKDTDSFILANELYHDIYNHPESISYNDGHQIARRATEQLDFHFILKKLKYICDQMARNVTFKEQHSTRLWKAVLEEAALLQHRYPIIGLHYRIAVFFQKLGTEEEFRDILREYYKQAPYLTVESQYFLINKIVTLVNLQLSKKRLSLIADLFQLYQHAERKGIFRANGTISDATFFNNIILGIRNKDFNWTRKYIKKNTPYLPASVINDAGSLGEAILFAEEEKYDAALQSLGQASNKAVAYRFRIHSLKVRCLLGMHIQNLKHYKPLKSAVTAFRRYIHRQDKISETRKKEYLNFGEAVLRVAGLRSHDWEDDDKREALLEWMRNLDGLMLRPWLENQLKRKPG